MAAVTYRLLLERSVSAGLLQDPVYINLESVSKEEHTYREISRDGPAGRQLGTPARQISHNYHAKDCPPAYPVPSESIEQTPIKQQY